MKCFIILLPFLVISSISLSQETSVKSGKASFRSIGDLPGGTFSSSAQGISADGKVIVGFGTTSSGEEAFRWTEETGMVSLGNLPDKSFKKSWANRVSADGKVIVGYGDPKDKGWNTYKGFMWTSSEGMQEIGRLDTSSRSMAFCVSGDGNIIAGDGGPAAFIWTRNSKTERLGVLPPRTHSRVVDMSADGKVMIGQSYSLPKWDDEDGFIMKEDGTMQSMSSLTGGKYCMVLCLSPDGSAVAGTTSSSQSSYPAFYWTKEKGFVSIGHLPEKNTTHPGDMTPYGKIIVGGSFSGPDNGDAFIWDNIHGMRNFQTVLEKEYGLDLKGWKLQNASGITPDGNVIVGEGINPKGQKEGFRVILNTTLTITDIDGNVYQTVKIGTQVWMKENLKTTHYRNGDAIPNVTETTAWENLTTGAYCHYNNNPANAAKYGNLYNFKTISDSRNICPSGWHVPTDAEWTELTTFLGGDSIAGGKLKESGTTHWTSENVGADNSSGFTALPGGDRILNGAFYLMGDYGFFWSATEIDNTNAYARALGRQVALVDRGPYNKIAGYSIRCLKDATTSYTGGLIQLP